MTVKRLPMILGFLVWTASSAQADNKAAAEELFDQGRQLMTERQYAAACEKFEASQRLDPGLGTMLNLATCYEKLGKTASAWAQFREARAAARAAGETQREKFAMQRAAYLEPRLSRLTIVPWAGQEVQITRNGVPVDVAEMGIAIPIDPGRHEIEASAPGKRSWSAVVVIGGNGAHEQVAIPILPEERAFARATRPQPVREPPRAAMSPAASDGGLGGRRIAALVSGGLAVAGAAVGVVFGLQANAQWNDALSNCNPRPFCNQKGVDLADDANTSATISTIGFSAGALALAAGAVLWLTGGQDVESAPPSVALSPLGLHGRF